MDAKSLTKEDLAILIEALDAWVRRDVPGEMITDLIGAIVSKENPMFKVEADKKKQEHREQQKRDEEIAILLKSKLVLIKQAL